MTDEPEPTITLEPSVPDNVIDALVGAYYPRIINLPDAARSRAQAGFAIASGIATALLALSFFTNLQDYRWFVWAVGVASLVVWVLAAGTYVAAVALPTNPPAQLVSRDNFTELASNILLTAVKERQTIDHRQVVAAWLAAGAAMLTFFAIVAALITGKVSDGSSGRIVFSSAGLSELSNVCKRTPAEITGEVKQTSLSDGMLSVTFDPGSCQDGEATVIVLKDRVVAIVPTPTSPTGTARIWGDGDCGGDIGPRDAQAVLKNVLVQTPLSQNQPCPAVGAQVTVDGVSRIWSDWDCGGDIGPRDAQAILKNVLVQSPLSQTQPCPAVGSTVQVVG